MNHRLTALSIATALLLGACGGGSPDPDPEPSGMQDMQTLTADMNGNISKTAADEYTGRDGPGLLWLGDTRDNTVYRGFLRFSLASIPAGARIESATLTTSYISPLGTPYFDLGDLLIEAIDMGGGLDQTDFDALASWMGVVPSNPNDGDKDVDVTEAIQMSLPAGTADFRIRFRLSTDGSGDTDVAFMNDSSDVGSNTGRDLSVPTLLVVYRTQ